MESDFETSYEVIELVTVSVALFFTVAMFLAILGA